MIELFPLDVLVAELEVVVEEVLPALTRDRTVRLLLLLDERRAVEVLTATPQLV